MGRQQTIKHSFDIEGIGVHTGTVCRLGFHPAPAGTGIVFQRIDLPGQPLIPATIDYVVDSFRCTRIADGAASVSTVEHVMAALSGLGIDNCHLTVDGPEVPIVDGSAATFIRMLKAAQVVEQSLPRQYVELSRPVWVSDGGRHMVALPSDRFCVSFTFTNDKAHPALTDQYAEVIVTPESFEKEIAPARTMGWLEEVESLRRKGLIQGASGDIAVVIGEESVLTPLRYPNELVRHKILDVIGDLALVGRLRAHVIGIRSGHRLNALLGRAILQTVQPDPDPSNLVSTV
ncbi:MAG: UDP-3-O-[3-hydroxymyristoyl] N-acetylglucosamine deacetylase [Firmicutes bacterium]|nr:UDP-3-O-[3-hydroxymyristoyl] N-acetylglucosamine deacetylase [Bacillota bacterium]